MRIIRTFLIWVVFAVTVVLVAILYPSCVPYGGEDSDNGPPPCDEDTFVEECAEFLYHATIRAWELCEECHPDYGVECSVCWDACGFVEALPVMEESWYERMVCGGLWDDGGGRDGCLSDDGELDTCVSWLEGNPSCEDFSDDGESSPCWVVEGRLEE